MQLTERGPARRVHQLKCWPPHFEEVAAGRKLADIRPDDRGFRVGDVIIQREWDPTVADTTDGERGQYTGRVCVCTITHIMRGGPFGLREGFVILSLGPADVLSGLPLESSEQWAVFYGGEDFDSCAGWTELTERAECEELLQFLCQDAGFGRRLVLYGPWEVVNDGG
jgi:hypothetical protein